MAGQIDRTVGQDRLPVEDTLQRRRQGLGADCFQRLGAQGLAVVFGREDILINNMAWILRTFPIFGLFGDGSYRLQPIYVDDLAALAVEEASASQNRIVDAIGPETFTYRALVEEQLDGHMVSVSGQLQLHYVEFSKLINPQTLLTDVRFIEAGSDFHRLARFLEAQTGRQFEWSPGRRLEPESEGPSE